MLSIVLAYMPRLDIPTRWSSPILISRGRRPGLGWQIWYAKIAFNCGPSVMVLQEADAQRYHQVLWLHGKEGNCTEAGG